MAKTLEQRVSEIEEVMADLPSILNVRFSRVDTELAALKEADAIASQKLNKIERGVNELRAEVAALPRVIADMLKDAG